MKLILFLGSFLFVVNSYAQNRASAEGRNRFAFDLFAAIPNEENVIVSPYSISSAMVIAYAGSKNSTADEICNVFKFNRNKDLAIKDYGELCNDILKKTKEGMDIKISNSVWLPSDFLVQDSYVQAIKNVCQSKINQIDFSQEKDASQSMNNWAKEKTNNRSGNLANPQVFDKNTRMVILNTVYFNGKWKYKFEPNSSKEKPFYVSSSKSMDAVFMNQRQHVNYYEDENLKAVELPYNGDDFSMFIILPTKIDGIKELTSNLSSLNYKKWSNSLKIEDVVVTIPKFKFGKEYDLKGTLQTLGMSVSFSDRADFGDITSHENLKIDKIMHSAFIEVDENGTEASATTSIAFKLTSANEPVNYKVFNANHPFIFFIKDNKTGMILFMCKILQP